MAKQHHPADKLVGTGGGANSKDFWTTSENGGGGSWHHPLCGAPVVTRKLPRGAGLADMAVPSYWIAEAARCVGDLGDLAVASFHHHTPTGMVFAHRIGRLSDSFPNLPICRGQSVACLPNLKKTADMAPGQVSFHDQRKVYRTTVASRKNAIARAWRVRSRGKEGGVGSFRQAQSGRCTSGVQTHTSPAVLPRHTNHLKSRKSY